MTDKRVADLSFPIVGIGASAGGLEALKLFFSNVDVSSAMAYIVVIHIPPDKPSMMAEIIQKVSPITVTTAQDGEIVKPDHVYVVPPGKIIHIFQSTFQLLDITKTQPTMAIDNFFCSLALDKKASAAGIILSGTGTDGTIGIQEIKRVDGLVLVQTEKSAAYDGMPGSAIASGIADAVCKPEDMPKLLHHYFNYLIQLEHIEPHSSENIEQNWLKKIFSLIRARTGHDFATYKKNTLKRRINRRMGMNFINKNEQYIHFLQENPNEVDKLFQEFLIGVTSFFRDIKAYDALKTDILPDILSKMEDNSTFRVWVPGCSTGEEVYSLAIIIKEVIERMPQKINLQLFGTDINEFSIEKARMGLYPESIARDVGEERLKKYFTQEGHFFRTHKEIRESAIFSTQNVLGDPPFSRLNMLSCRNLLIYFDSDAQKKIMPLFHYTLQKDGILFLGTSETIGNFTHLFHPLDNPYKIFKRKEVPPSLIGSINFPTGSNMSLVKTSSPKEIPPFKKETVTTLAQRAILEQFTPTSVLVDPRGNILHIHGHTGKYLEHTSGPPSHNIIDLAREGLRTEISFAIRKSALTKNRISRYGIIVKTDTGNQSVNLHVISLTQPRELADNLMVVFTDAEMESDSIEQSDTQSGSVNKKREFRITELEQELQNLRENQQTIVEELESSNEELKSTNEELQSSNEELQSANEEMESSKEELQSMNEEMQTMNAELQSKLEELYSIKDDMRNLLNGIEIATIFVDNQMRIKRYNETATQIINLINSDIGRPLKHIANNLDYDTMYSDLQSVIDKLVPFETEIMTKNHTWYIMRIVPYRTIDNRIDGAVLTFSNISNQKIIQYELEEKELLLRAIFDMSSYPIVILDDQNSVIIANNFFYQLFHITTENILAKDFFLLQNNIFKHSNLKKKLEDALVGKEDFISSHFRLNDGTSCQAQGKIIHLEKKNSYHILLQFLTGHSNEEKNNN